MMRTNGITRKSSQEVQIDHLLAEEFECDPNFAERFATACGLRFETFQVREVTAEPSLAGDGYGDLMVEAEKDGQRVAFLIEDKITAGAPPRQAARYAVYAERLRREGWDRVMTVLVAPRSYRGERDQYDESVDLEAVAEMLDSCDPRRRRYRRNVILWALEKKASTGVRNPDPAMHRLHSDYRNWVEARGRGYSYEFPTIKKEYYDGDSWVDKIRLPDFPGNVWLRHRLWTSQKEAAGMVDLIFSPASADDRQLLEFTVPSEAIVSHYGIKEQGVQVSFRVPEMRQSTGFSETVAMKAISAMDRLSGYFLRLERR